MGPLVLFYALISVPLLVIALVSSRKTAEEKKENQTSGLRGWIAFVFHPTSEEAVRWREELTGGGQKKRKKQRISRLVPLFHAFTALAILVVILLVFVAIVLHSKELGVFFVPAVIAYVAVLALAGWFLNHQKEKLELHGMVGDEIYYAIYPVDRFFHEKRELLRKRLAARKQGRRGGNDA
jgi:ABC-type transport system involved in cytochrome c biogenesis permease subunit